MLSLGRKPELWWTDRLDKWTNGHTATASVSWQENKVRKKILK